MRWSRGRRSENLRDLRGTGSRTAGLPIPAAGAVGLPAILLLVVGLLFGGGNILGGDGGGGYGVDNPFDRLPAAPPAPSGGPLPGAPDPDAELVDFVSFVLDDVQRFWTQQFVEADRAYQDAQLVLFEEAVQSGCGPASSATGPFYCPLDRTAYLDLGFFRDLAARFDAPGDFAQAYVLAHEIAHHVQNLTGVNAEVRRLSERSPDDANELSVRQELQADCLAGVWAHSTYQRGILEGGDLQEGLDAAAGVGDDRIQRQAGTRVNPETWTHGSSDQRVRWLQAGYRSGDPDACDTFSGDA